MKYGLTNFKEFNHFNYESATVFVKQNWMKMIAVFFVLFIILKKDISLNFNLQAAGSSAHPIPESYEPSTQRVSYSAPAEKIKAKEINKSNSEKPKKQSSSMNMLPSYEPAKKVEEKKVKLQPAPIPKVKDNRANHFANLTFILSPTYAKRKNIDPEIVMARQKTVYDYIRRYSDIAVAEMKKYGIPASITLAQGLLESDAGESRLARKNNNHFGIKCFSKKCSKGHCANFTDDTHKDFFRKYKSVWESYRAHSVFLQGKRYIHLQNLDIDDYKGWANGLRMAGYATDKKYADKLIKIIEVLDLNRLDK